jgi:hypothetical protein
MVCIRATVLPFAVDECLTFFNYARTGEFVPLLVPPTTNNHFLNSALENASYNIFGVHKFTLRLPNVISFVIYLFAVFGISGYLKNIASRYLFMTLALINFYLLDFFELSRGYGISLGCIMMGMLYLFKLLEGTSLRNLNLCLLFFQLAVAANLTFLSTFVFIITLTIFFVVYKRKEFSTKQIILAAMTIMLHLLLILYWVKVIFFYKKNGAIDFGAGESYWDVTFRTLIQLLYGACPIWLSAILITSFFVTVIGFLWQLWKLFTRQTQFFSHGLIFPVILLFMITAFYLQKRLLNVYFPSDRAGLVLYPLFILSFSLSTDQAPKIIRNFIVAPFIILLFSNFVWRINFSGFSSRVYRTLPEKFYKRLVEEQAKTKEVITIEGEKADDQMYKFQNFREDSKLNPMSKFDFQQMHADYCVAPASSRFFYSKYYSAIDSDEVSTYYLLKRNSPLKRSLIFSSDEKKEYRIQEGFAEIFHMNDTILSGTEPLEFELDLELHDTPVNFTAYLIMTYANEKNEGVGYHEIVISALQDRPKELRRRFKLVSGTIPAHLNHVSIFLWHQAGSRWRLTVNSRRMYQLKGKGVKEYIPYEYYRYICNMVLGNLK